MGLKGDDSPALVSRPVRKLLSKCPVCKSGHDGYMYEPDEEQIKWGYPAKFRLCETCACPMLEVGKGHCKEFV